MSTLSLVVDASRAFSRLGAAAVAAAALMLPASAGASDIATRTLHQSPAEVRAYWTPERIASARPASELLAGVPAPNDLIEGLLGGGSPSTRAAAQQIGDPSKAPYRTHGKVLFTLDGARYVCSGTVVPAKHKRLVVTAGHCVYSFGEFATNWMFVPGKNGADEPYGRWTAQRLATTGRWEASEDLRYDVGMAKMERRNGRRLQKVVGARRIAFGLGRNLHFDAFGYPARAPFSGSQLYRCSSNAQGTDGGPAPAPTRIDCDMTGGASGGGWVTNGRVNSVTSYGYDPVCPILCPDPDGEKLYGPYFGSAIQDLYRSQRRKRR